MSEALSRLLVAAEAVFGTDEAAALPKPILDELADAIAAGRKHVPLIFGKPRDPSEKRRAAA